MKSKSLNHTAKAALALGVVVLLGALAACGGSGGSKNNNNGGGPPPTTAAEFLYAGNIVGQVFGYSIDPNSGALTPVAGSPFAITAAQPAGFVRLATDSTGAVLYASSAGIGGPNLLSFTINSGTGALTPAGSQALPIAPGKIAADPSGKNLYVIPDQSAATPEVIAFSIDPTTHALAALPNQPAGTNPSGVAGIPHDITVDPSGKYVYITFQGTPGDEIAGRLRDATTGQLSVLAGSPFGNLGGDSPQAIRITPNGGFAIIANQATNNISVMALTPATGMLTNVGGSPFADGTNPGAVAIDPTGKFAFVVDTSTSLSVFSIGAAGGLTPVAGSPFAIGAQGVDVAVDPSGKFVYTSNVNGTISGFSLNTGTGALTPITGSPFVSGATLRGIVAVKP